jgi:hypothetical protein
MYRAYQHRQNHLIMVTKLRVLHAQFQRHNDRWRGVGRPGGRVDLDTWEDDNDEAWIAYFR